MQAGKNFRRYAACENFFLRENGSFSDCLTGMLSVVASLIESILNFVNLRRLKGGWC